MNVTTHYEAELDQAESTQLDTARSLSDIAKQIESFLHHQVDRLQETLRTRIDLSEMEDFPEGKDIDDEALQRCHAAIQEEKRLLAEEAERLTAAWGELEQEQRRLLSQQALSQHSFCKTTSPSNTGKANATETSSGTVAGPLPASGGQVGGSTKLQFQQLRREMQKHSQRRKH